MALAAFKYLDIRITWDYPSSPFNPIDTVSLESTSFLGLSQSKKNSLKMAEEAELGSPPPTTTSKSQLNYRATVAENGL